MRVEARRALIAAGRDAAELIEEGIIERHERRKHVDRPIEHVIEDPAEIAGVGGGVGGVDAADGKKRKKKKTEESSVGDAPTEYKPYGPAQECACGAPSRGRVCQRGHRLQEDWASYDKKKALGYDKFGVPLHAGDRVALPEPYGGYQEGSVLGAFEASGRLKVMPDGFPGITLSHPDHLLEAIPGAGERYTDASRPLAEAKQDPAPSKYDRMSTSDLAEAIAALKAQGPKASGVEVAKANQAWARKLATGAIKNPDAFSKLTESVFYRLQEDWAKWNAEHRRGGAVMERPARAFKKGDRVRIKPAWGELGTIQSDEVQARNQGDPNATETTLSVVKDGEKFPLVYRKSDLELAESRLSENWEAWDQLHKSPSAARKRDLQVLYSVPVTGEAWRDDILDQTGVSGDHLDGMVKRGLLTVQSRDDGSRWYRRTTSMAGLSESAQTAALSVTHAPIGKGGTNWVTKSKPGNTGQLPAYIQNIRNAMMRDGKDESSATAMAVGAVKRWASGRGGVSDEVKAAAAKAVAEWEATRAAGTAGEKVDKAAKKAA